MREGERKEDGGEAEWKKKGSECERRNKRKCGKARRNKE